MLSSGNGPLALLARPPNQFRVQDAGPWLPAATTMDQVPSRQTRDIFAFVAVYASVGSLGLLAAVQGSSLSWGQQTAGVIFIAASSILLYDLLHGWQRGSQLEGVLGDVAEPPPDDCHLLFAHHPQACWIHDPHTLEILTANQAAGQLCGCSVSELTHLNLRDLAAPETLATLEASGDHPGDRPTPSRRGRIRDRQGQLHEVELAITPIPYAGKTAHLTLLREASRHEHLEAQLHQSVFYDPLTQLPNKAWFLNQLQAQLQATREGTASFFTVLFLELDRFNAVKYSLGHQIAEAMLAATAERLQSCLNLSEPVARVGDCALAVVLDTLYTALDAEAIADYIHQQLGQPLEVQERQLFSPVRIGMAIVDRPDLADQRPEALLQAADTAMNHARQKLKTAHAIFEPAMFELASGYFHLETDLRQAIARQEFTVLYQPIVDLSSGRLTGFEALVRWQLPDGRWIAPEQFIPVAEETGLIGLIDWWMLGEACRQLGVWQQQLPAGETLNLSLNASGALLSQLGVLERLRQVLAVNHLQRGSLILEVTERVIVEHHISATGMLAAIKDLGLQLAIDDFGTGYSCLERLYQLPIDILKIDRSFVSLMLADADSLEIVRAILTLARGLGMKATAEGTETLEQVQQLQQLGCQFSQGYFFAEPLESEEATQRLKHRWQW